MFFLKLKTRRIKVDLVILVNDEHEKNKPLVYLLP